MSEHGHALQERLMARAREIIEPRLQAAGDTDPLSREHLAETELQRPKSRIDQWVPLVPALWCWADIGQLGPGQKPDVIRTYLPDRTRNLILAGPVGTGKSFAAWSILHEATAHGLRCRAWSLPRLLLDMRPEGDPSAFRGACSADVLLLDDLGTAKPTDWATEQIYSIVEDRCSNRRRTIVTTNATWDQLVALWGAPTMDRLRDQSVTVTMLGSSRRSPK